MPQVWGMRILGVVALVWLVDCFVGFYLTLPYRRKRAAPDIDMADGNGNSDNARSFWERWKPAWQIKLRANPYRLNFDVHRATGLWLWALLLVLAVSGVYLTLRYEVFRPVVAAVTPISPDPFERPTASAEAFTNDPSMSYRAIVATATEEAKKRGWAAPYDVFHSPDFGLYGVGFGDHHAAGLGVPYLYFDAATGRVLSEIVPGQGTAGDVFMQWLFPLHTGRVAGWPGRILVSFSGLAVAVLSVTGLVIWARKRRGRRALATRERDERAA
jgi:uncharacterized iron-regulated membrane protein